MHQIKPEEQKLLNEMFDRFFTKIKSIFKQIQQRYKNIPWSKGRKFSAIIITPCFLLLILILMLVAASSQHKNYAAKSTTKTNAKILAAAQIMQQSQDTETFNNLQTKLDQIKQQLAASNQTQNIQQLENQLTALTQSVSEIADNLQATKETAQKNVLATQQNYQQTQQHAKQIESQLKAIHKRLTPAKYLSAKLLPFKVVGIDFWNGKPMVTIAIHDVTGTVQYRLMGEDMSYNNWKLQTLLVSPKTAIFKNAKNQRVKVGL